MNKAVFDSSAILSIYYNEPGKRKVLRLLDRSEPLISAPNACEVFTKLIEGGLNEGEALESFDGLEIKVVDFDTELALRTAALRPATRTFGLSMGDRSCLALAIRENAMAVTADKNWASVTVCPVELIR